MTAGLPSAVETEIVELSGGSEVELGIGPVAKRIGDATLRMLAYNGSIPGPTLRVQQGSEVVVNVLNDGDLEATVHWHGLRVENRFDGTHETQDAMLVGERFSYRLQFPDPGVYWYHPHIREDYGQELGLYGNILVVPADPDYWPPVNGEIALTLDDVLIEDGKGFESAPLSSIPSALTTVGAHEFREHFGWCMQRAATGEGIAFTRRGKPVLRLIAADERAPAWPVRHRDSADQLAGAKNGFDLTVAFVFSSITCASDCR